MFLQTKTWNIKLLIPRLYSSYIEIQFSTLIFYVESIYFNLQWLQMSGLREVEVCIFISALTNWNSFRGAIFLYLKGFQRQSIQLKINARPDWKVSMRNVDISWTWTNSKVIGQSKMLMIKSIPSSTNGCPTRLHVDVIGLPPLKVQN